MQDRVLRPALAAVAFVIVLLSPAPAAGQDETGRLIRQLGDADLAVREEASARLFKLGESVRPALLEASGSRDPEIRARATDILAKLDRIARLSRLENVCGRLGDTDVIWAEQLGFGFLADPGKHREWMKPALVASREPAVVLVVADERRIRYSEIVYAGSTVHMRRYAGTSGWNASGGRTLLFDRAEGAPTGATFFRNWRGTKNLSFVFVSPKSYDGLLKGLHVALAHERADVRAAATHALQHYYFASSGAKARRMLDDRSPMVQDAARQTLAVLAGAPEEGAAAWWDALSDERRAALVIARYDAASWVNEPCCKDIFGE
jgi:hypothetical protein